MSFGPSRGVSLRRSTNDDALPEGKLAFSVSEFGKRTDLSRSLLYEAIKCGDLNSIKIRGRRLILAEDGIAWLRSHREPVCDRH
jgi:hypothetical protein